MEITQFWKKAPDFWKKYKYVIIILLFGLFLMLLPDFSYNEKESTLQAKATQQPEESVEEKLTAILSQIDGAGEVRVMLSYARGEETVYQTDADNSSGENNSSTRVESVITPSHKGSPSARACTSYPFPILMSIIEIISTNINKKP